MTRRTISLVTLSLALALGAPTASQAAQGGVFNHGAGLKVRVGRPHGGGFKPFCHGGFKRRGIPRGFLFFPRSSNNSQPAPPRQVPRPAAKIPAPPPSPGPKWIHVGPTGNDTLLSGTTLAQGDSPADCLSVETEILLDDEPVKAFGTACREADGTWRLRPAEPTSN